MLGSPAVNDKFFYKRFYVAGVVLTYFTAGSSRLGAVLLITLFTGLQSEIIYISLFISLPSSPSSSSLYHRQYIQYIPVINP